MQSEEYIPVGKLGKPHGVSGAFRFYLSRVLKNKTKFPPHFLIAEKGGMLPFFVSSFELIKLDEALLKFEDITSPEQARAYNGKELYLTQKNIHLYFERISEDIDYLIGYMLMDEQKGKVGEISELLESPAQILAIVQGETQEFTIPLAEDWIVEIEEKRKVLRMDLPEGLLDI